MTAKQKLLDKWQMEMDAYHPSDEYTGALVRQATRDHIRELSTLSDSQEVNAELLEALESRSRWFHRAERERTGTFAGPHGQWMSRIFDKWEECPTHPCPSDRALIEKAKAAILREPT